MSRAVPHGQCRRTPARATAHFATPRTVSWHIAVSQPWSAVSRPKVPPSTTIQNFVSRPSVSQAPHAHALPHALARSRPCHGQYLGRIAGLLAVSWSAAGRVIAPLARALLPCVTIQKLYRDSNWEEGQ